MINIIFMAKETYSSRRSLEYLCNLNGQIKVIAALTRPSDYGLNEICRKYDIKILSEEELLAAWNNQLIFADYIFSFYWKKVKKEILAIPQYGSINFHPGPLPEARGSGYHVAILEDWGYWGVTAHYMDEEFDTGDIISCQRFEIDKDIVNKDLVRETHQRLVDLFIETVTEILSGEKLERKMQGEGTYFSLEQLEKTKDIQDTDSIDVIDRKVRAFWNPPYSGAQICIKGKKYTVINDQILQWVTEHIKNEY